MNNRQKNLLRILLLQKEGALHIKSLSEELDCSEKTVRNDLDRLEEFLLDYPHVILSRRPGFGISIEINQEDRTNIFHHLFANEPKKAEDRLFEVTYELLTSQKAITLQSLAERYYLPKASVKKDLEIITDWLKRFDLELVSKQRLGHVVQGSELQKRNALARLSEFAPSNPVEKNDVLQLFLPYEISAVKKALIDMRNQFSIPFTDGALESLQVHALIMLKRTRQRSPVFIQESEKERIYKQKEYQYARWFFEQLEPTFRIAFSEEEKIYFTWHLISSKRIGEEAKELAQYDEKTVQVVLTFIDKMSKLTLVDFVADSTLTNGLFVHMHSVIHRIRYGFPITNPLLANIKKMYPYIFNMIILTLEEIKKNYHLDIPEDEAAYLALHFQASIERMESKKDIRKKALIVCHLGMGMSYLLEAKIKQQYQGIEIVACIGKAEALEHIKRYQVDFIISTIPLEKIAVANIVVSPLFGQEDQQQLDQFVDKLKQQRTRPIQSTGFASMVSEELVFMDMDYEHRYEVVEMLANALYQRGYAEKELIHSAVSRERMSATSIGGAVAIPHGNPSFIRKSAIAVGILKNPLNWGNESVSVVFLLAISKEDHGDIRGIIGKIASLSESPALVQELIHVRDKSKFLQLLKQKE